MNKTYRIVWNEARHAFVVANENSKAKGKPSSKRKAVASAVIMALAVLAAEPVYANCGVSGTTSIVAAETLPCLMTTGETVVVVTNTGTISGAATSNGMVRLSGGAIAGSITNSGTIANSAGHGIYIEGSTLSGNILNNSGALIQASIVAIYLNGGKISGGITNSGSISGVTGIEIYGSLSGGITNTFNSAPDIGTISGGSKGIFIGGGASPTLADFILNAGSISGGVTGISISNATLSGGVTNTGKISGVGVAGIDIANGTLSNGINNTGKISGANYGILVGLTSSITGGINNSGTINGGTAGVSISNSALSGGITNSGTITGSGSYGIQINAGTVNNGITNTVTISGYLDGINISNNSAVTGGINNSGAISAASSGGINVANSSTITGGITNSGTISGQHAIYVDSSSTLDGITITGANTAAFIGDVFAQNTPVTILGGSTFTGTNAFDVQSFDIASGALFNMTAMPSLSSGPAGVKTIQGVTNAGTLSIAEGVTGTITGSYSQSLSGVFQLGATSTSNFGKLVVKGTATLPNNANIYVNVNKTNLFGSGGGRLAAVISADTLVSNGFHVTSNSVLVDFIGVKNNNQVDLNVVVPGGVLANVNALGNNTARGAASVLENLLSLRTSNGTTGNAEMDLAIDKLISNSTSQQNVSNAVSQTLPLLMGGETAAITGSLHSMNHIVQSRLEGQLGLSSGDSYYEDGRAWVKPFGSSAKQGDDQGISGFSALTSGLVFGADTNVDRSNRLGAALTLANTNVSGNSTIAQQSSNVATYQLSMYGSQSLGDVTEVNFLAGVGDHYSRGSRTIAFAGSVAQSSYHSISGQLGVGITHALLLGEVTTFTPSLRFDYTTVHGDTYSESGAGGLNLNVDKSIVNEMLISVDGKFTRKVGEHFVLTGNAGVGYDTLAKQNSITSAFAGDLSAASFTTPGLSPSRMQPRGGLGFIRTKNDLEVMIRYDVDTRASHFIDQTLSAKCRWLF